MYYFSKRSYYQILDVQPSTEPKQIKDNFYKLSKEYHPDLNKVNSYFPRGTVYNVYSAQDSFFSLLQFFFIFPLLVFSHQEGEKMFSELLILSYYLPSHIFF